MFTLRTSGMFLEVCCIPMPYFGRSLWLGILRASNGNVTSISMDNNRGKSLNDSQR